MSHDGEKFAWLASVCADPEQPLRLVAGPGFVTIQPHPQGYATVRELRADPCRGWLLSASAVLGLRVGDEVRYPLLCRDARAPVSPNRWQVPAGRCDPGELPLAGARRELVEELGVRGEISSWEDAVHLPGGPEVEYLTLQGTHRFQARWGLVGNTVEFYFPLERVVSSFDAVELFDLEPFGRPVQLFTWEQVQDLAAQNLLAEGTTVIARDFRPR